MQGMFERTLLSREARRCVLLWRCYLAAELHHGRPQAARRVFLRAIHECPGSQVRRCTEAARCFSMHLEVVH